MDPFRALSESPGRPQDDPSSGGHEKGLSQPHRVVAASRTESGRQERHSRGSSRDAAVGPDSARLRARCAGGLGLVSIDVLWSWDPKIFAFFLERGADPLADLLFAHAFRDRIRTALGCYLDCKAESAGTRGPTAGTGGHRPPRVQQRRQPEVGQPSDVGWRQPALAGTASRVPGTPRRWSRPRSRRRAPAGTWRS